MTVYLDSLFLLNFLLDYLLLLLSGRILGRPLARKRILLGAVFGAGYAAAVFYPGFPFLAHPSVRMAAGVGMVMLAYGRQRRLLRGVVVFFALSAAFAGGLYALSFLQWGVQVYGGFFVPTLDLKRILFFAALAYCVFSLFCRKLGRHSASEMLDVVVHLEGRKTRLRALLDTGNTLSDPMTGQRALVAEGEALRALLPPEADLANPAVGFSALRPPGRFCLLPYRSVGVAGGLLLGMRVDSIEVNGKTISTNLVALSPTPVSETGQYQALLGAE